MPSKVGPGGIDRRVAARIRRRAARRGGEDDAYSTVELRGILGRLAMRLSRRRRIAAMAPLLVAAVAWFALPSLAASNTRTGERVVGETNSAGDFALWSTFAGNGHGGYVGFGVNARVAGYFELAQGHGQVAAYGAGAGRSHDRSDVLREATGAGPQISYILSHFAPAATGPAALADPAAEAAAVQLAIYGYTDDTLSHPARGTDGWVGPVDARARAIKADADANARNWWNAQSTTVGGTLLTGVVLIPVNHTADQSLVYLKSVKQSAVPRPTGGNVRAGAWTAFPADTLAPVADAEPAVIGAGPATSVVAVPLASCPPAQPAAGIGGPQVLSPGTSATYVAGFSNQGTVAIGPSNLTMQVPDGFVIGSMQPQGEVTGQDINYRIDSLAPGESQTFQVTVAVPASAAAGQVKATAEVTTTPQYTDSACTPVPADTMATATSTIGPVAGQVEGVAVGGPLTIGSPEFATPNIPTTGALGDALRDVVCGLCFLTSGMIVLTGIRRNPHAVMVATGTGC